MKNLLKNIRRSKGFTLAALSTKSGIPLSTIGNFETGRRGINEEYLKKIADALDVPVADIARPVVVEDGPEYFVKGIGKVEPNGYVDVPPALLAEWLTGAIEREDWKTAAQISALLNGVAKENLRRQSLKSQTAESKEEGGTHEEGNRP